MTEAFLLVRPLLRFAELYNLPPMCLAIPGRITSISGEDPLGRVGKIDYGGVLKEASLAYVPEAEVGDYVIVHVGFALSRIDPDEANKVFEYLREMQELADLEENPVDIAVETEEAKGNTGGE
jgi:hydrogenase expression/formation protein HypC